MEIKGPIRIKVSSTMASLVVHKCSLRSITRQNRGLRADPKRASLSSRVCTRRGGVGEDRARVEEDRNFVARLAAIFPELAERDP